MSYENDLDFEKPMKSLFDIGKKISDNVYTGNRPTATKSQMDDFVVVSIGGNLESNMEEVTGTYRRIVISRYMSG